MVYQYKDISTIDILFLNNAQVSIVLMHKTKWGLCIDFLFSMHQKYFFCASKKLTQSTSIYNQLKINPITKEAVS